MAQVVSRQFEFAVRQIQVVTISFGTPSWADVWLAETQSPFPLLLDPDLVAYQVYGLQRSVLHSWGWNNLRYYAKAILRGQKFSVNRGDMNQLGGDFLVDAGGILRLVHPSVDPTDRPALSALLSAL